MSNFDVKDILQLAVFFSSGDTKKAETETKQYNKALDNTSTKLGKVLKDIELLDKVNEEYKKTLESQNNEISEAKKKQKELNKIYDEQANKLDKLKAKFKDKKNIVDNTKKVKEAEKELNATLKARQKIEANLSKLTKERSRNELKSAKNTTNKEKLNLEMQKLERQRSNLATLKTSKGKPTGGSFIKDSLEGVATYSKMTFALRTAFAPLAGTIQDLAQIEKNITSLGVVAGKSGHQIKSLRRDLLEMSTTSIYSASQLSESLEQIVRTGKTLEDAKNIVTETIGLATASFESLSFATMTVNKAMVALQIQSEDASKVVNAFHNIVLSTPLDLRTLDESLRQTASAFGTVVEFSGRSGEDLQEYKLQVLDTVSALTGAMALMGKTGSQAGTSLKMFGTKLLAMTPAAGGRLDAEMVSKGINLSETAMSALGMSPEQVEKGVKMSTTMLTRLVKKDLDVALNEVSRLYQTGALSFETLAKMFGQRHVGQIATMLTMVGGDIGEFKNELLSMRKVTEDSEIALGSWAASLDKAGNSFTRLKGTLLDFLDTTGKGVLDFLSSVMNGMSRISETTPGLVSGLLGAGAAFTGMVGIGAKVKTTIDGITAAETAMAVKAGVAARSIGQLFTASLLNPYVLAAAGIAMTIGLIIERTARLNKLERDRVDNAIELDNITNKTAVTIHNLQSSKLKIQKTINGQLSIESTHWKNITGFIKEGAGELSKFYGGMTDLDMTLSENKDTTSIKQRTEMDYIKIQEKRIKTLSEQKDVDEEALKIEKQKLSYAKQGQRLSGAEGLLAIGSARKTVSATAKNSEEVESRIGKVSKDKSKYEREFFQDERFDEVTSSTVQALDKVMNVKPIISKVELANQLMTMSSLEFSNFYKVKKDTLEKEIQATDKNKYYNILALRKQTIYIDNLLANVNEMKKNATYKSKAMEEISKLENDAMSGFLDTYQEDMNKIARFQGVVNRNISRIQGSMLNKKNIDNVAEMYEAIGSIAGKDTERSIKGMFSDIRVGGRGIQNSDIVRATKGGTDLSIINESIAAKKAIDIQKGNVQAKKDSLVSLGIQDSAIDESKAKFLKAKDEKGRRDVLESMYGLVDANDERKDKIKAEMMLFLSSSKLEASIRKEYILKMKDKIALTDSEIKASDIIFKKTTKQEIEHMKAMANAKNDSLKLLEKTNELNRNRNIEERKYALARASQSAESQKLFKSSKGGLLGDALNKLNVDMSNAETFSSTLENMFENPEEFNKLLKTEMPQEIRDILTKLRRNSQITDNAEKEIGKLKAEEISLLRETNKLKMKINLERIDSAGEREKQEMQARHSKVSGDVLGFGKVQEFKMLKLDKSIVDRKIAYLRNQEESVENSRQIAELERKGYELEMESFEKKRGAIRDVANMGLNMVVNAATTGEIPRVDNAAMMSSFGDLAATFLGGDAPDLPQQSLDVDRQQLSQLEIIDESIRNLGGSKFGSKDSLTDSIKTVAEKGIDNTLKLAGFKGDKKGLVGGVGLPTDTGAGVEAKNEGFAYGLKMDAVGAGKTVPKQEGVGGFFSGLMDDAKSSMSSFKSKWTGKDASGKKLAEGKKFSTADKVQMGAQATQAGLGMINAFTQAEADYKLQSLKAEGQVLETRLQGAQTEEEKAALEKQIYENKKKQIKAEYKSKTQFMGMSGTTGAALGGAAKGAMAGAAGGPMGMAVGAGMGLLGGIMGGNKAKADMKQQLAALKVQEDIKKLNEDRNKMLEANNTFMGTFGKYAGKVGIEEGMNAAFKSIKDTGTMAIGGAGIETWTESHGSGKGKYKTQESIQRTVGLSDIGMARDTFDSLADTEEAILRTESKLAQYRRGWGHDAKAMTKAYENMLKNLKNIRDVHKSNISIYKSYFGAKLTEEKDGDMITGYSADWNDFRGELLAISSDQALAGMDADVQKFTKNFFDGITDAFVQNSSDLNNIISKSVIPAYDLMANVLNMEYDDMDSFNKAFNDAMAGANSANETAKKHEINNIQVKKSMELLALATKQYKEEQTLVNKTIGDFEDTWVSAGGKISDILDSATQGTKDLYNSLMVAIGDGSKAGLESLIGSDIIKGIGESNMRDALDSLSKNIVDISKAATDGKSNIEDFSKSIDKYLAMSDALGDFERYKDELKKLGMSDEEISKLEYQMKLQELLNDKIEERMTLSDLESSRISSMEKEIQSMITEISKAGGYSNVDQIVKDRYNELLKKLQGSSNELKNTTREFTQAWLEGTIDGVFDEVKSGLTEETQDLFSSIESAFDSDNFADMGSEIGSSIANSIMSSYKDNIMNSRYKEEIAMINRGMFDVISGAEGGTLSILGSAQVSQSVQRLAVEMEQERQRMAAIESLFDYGRKINYDQTANQVNYQTSSSKESVYNITNTNNFNVGTIIGKDYQMREFANVIAPFMERAMKNLGSSMKK